MGLTPWEHLGALNRVYLNIGLFSEEWLLHFRALVGGAADLADRDCGCQQEFRVLGGHRGADSRHGAVLPEEHRAAPAEGRSRRRRLHHQRQGQVGARQGSVRGALRALPLQQDSGGCAGNGCRRRLLRQGVPGLLEQVLGVDEDRRLQGQDARHRAEAGLPRQQLSFNRYARAGDAAADQRMQSAGDERDRR